MPLDLNLIFRNKIDISKEPSDFVFTGTSNNVEFLPPYFDILDSLTSTQTDNDDYNSYSIELLITGTLENPIRNGKIVIQNGNLYLDPIVGSIKNISGSFMEQSLILFFILGIILGLFGSIRACSKYLK